MLGFPDFPQVNVAELFAKLDALLDNLASFDKSGLPPEKQEVLKGLQELIERNTSTLKETLPNEVATMRSDFNRALAGVASQKEELDREVARVRRLIEDMPALVSQANEEANQARQRAEAEMEQQLQILLKPLQRAAEELPLSPGDALRELLLPTAAQRVAQAPKVAGNIWENWRKVGETPTEDEELGPDEDLEG